MMPREWAGPNPDVCGAGLGEENPDPDVGDEGEGEAEQPWYRHMGRGELGSTLT